MLRSSGAPGVELTAQSIFAGNLTHILLSCWLHDPNFATPSPQHSIALNWDDNALSPATYWSMAIGVDHANNVEISVLRQSVAAGTETAWSIVLGAPAAWPACTTNLLVSVDFVSYVAQVYLNDQPLSVANIPTPPTAWFTGGVPLTNTDLLEYFPGTAETSTYVSDLWCGQMPSFVDLTVTANRRKFINADLTPVSLGPSGALPFGTSPTLYQTLPIGDTVASDWLINHGTAGGTFAATFGTLLSADGDPCVDTTETPPPPTVTLAMDDVSLVTIPTPGCQVFLQWSDDRGHVWGSPVGQQMGNRGEYLASLQWQRLGYARDRVFQVFWSCPAKTVLQGAWIELDASPKT